MNRKSEQRKSKLKEYHQRRKSLMPITPELQDYRRLMGDKTIKKDIRNDLLKLPKEEYYSTIQLSHPQQYGSLLQERIKHRFKLSKSTGRNSGDASEYDTVLKIVRNWEIKGSLITKSNLIANLHQFRFYHDCDYLFLIADVRDSNNCIEYFFQLTHEQLLQELIPCNAYNSHNNKEANRDNKNVEKSIDLPFDIENSNSNFNRWCKKYRIRSPWDNDLNENEYAVLIS